MASPQQDSTEKRENDTMTATQMDKQTKTELYQKMVTYRRELHAHPELSAKELETTESIR